MATNVRDTMPPGWPSTEAPVFPEPNSQSLKHTGDHHPMTTIPQTADATTGWRPIETAPKKPLDECRYGPRFFAFNTHGFCFSCFDAFVIC